jgi:hypothetical protein
MPRTGGHSALRDWTAPTACSSLRHGSSYMQSSLPAYLKLRLAADGAPGALLYISSTCALFALNALVAHLATWRAIPYGERV